MDTEKGLSNGKFSFKVLPDGSVDKTKVICIYCKCKRARSKKLRLICHLKLTQDTNAINRD